MRVSASRWAAVAPPKGVPEKGPFIVTVAEETGETCVLLADAKKGPSNPLAKRCTYGLVWTASETLNREGTALALAVQPTESWREMWVFQQDASGWSVDVLPPAVDSAQPGYVEFAGWVPGGKQMLMVRESVAEGRFKRSFEVLRLDTLVIEKQASSPSLLAAFRKSQDPAWKSMTVSLR